MTGLGRDTGANSIDLKPPKSSEQIKAIREDKLPMSICGDVKKAWSVLFSDPLFIISHCQKQGWENLEMGSLAV